MFDGGYRTYCPFVLGAAGGDVPRVAVKLWRGAPYPQWTMRRESGEVVIRGQECQPVAHTQLREQGVDSADLSARAAAQVPQVCRFYVILSVRNEKRQRSKALDDVLASFRPGESLEELLQDEAGGNYDFGPFEGSSQQVNLRHAGRSVSAKGERPDARVDEQTHRRARAAL
jgi:hypothetical protein